MTNPGTPTNINTNTVTNTDTNIVIVAGADAIHAGSAPALREIADRTNIGVLNTWAAKGLFPWNHPAHLGTIGLQEDDIELAGLPGFDDVVLCGVSDDELERDRLDELGVRWREIAPNAIADERLPFRAVPTPRPLLYDRLAAVCQPMYLDDSLPVNPARAAADLAALLPDDGVVTADAGRAGFWIGRTFPTRALGSVQLPTRPTPGFAVTHAMTARRVGRFAVAVVDRIDDTTRALIDRARDLVVEVWSNDGPLVGSQERADRLLEAQAAGGVTVIEIGVRLDDIGVLEAVAGAALWHA